MSEQDVTQEATQEVAPETVRTEPVRTEPVQEQPVEQEPVTAQKDVPEPAPQPTFEPTGIPFYDNAGKVLSKAGKDPNDFVGKLKEAGEVTDELREELAGAVGAEQAFFLEQGYKQQQADEQRERQAVYDTVGGKDAWDQIAEWTKGDTALTKDDIATYNKMLREGGKQAQIAARQIKEAYMNDPNTSTPAAAPMHGDSAAPAGVQVEAISRAQYVEEKTKARREGDAVKIDQLEKRARWTMANKPEQWRPVRRSW